MLNSDLTHLKLISILAKIGWVDVVAVILILWGLVAGIKRGLEIELPRFLEIVVATIVTFHYYESVGAILHTHLSAPQSAAKLFSFLGIALICVLVMKLFFKITGTLVSLKFMAAISRVGGGLIGILRFILTLSLLSYFLLMLPLDFFRSSFTFERSWSGPFFAQTSEKFYRFTTYYVPFKFEKPNLNKTAESL